MRKREEKGDGELRQDKTKERDRLTDTCTVPHFPYVSLDKGTAQDVTGLTPMDR